MSTMSTEIKKKIFVLGKLFYQHPGSTLFQWISTHNFMLFAQAISSRFHMLDVRVNVNIAMQIVLFDQRVANNAVKIH